MSSDISIKNYMEDLVQDRMPKVLGQLEICQCERCLKDILANVLNKLPPKYVVTRKGQLYTKINTLQHQFDVDIISAIARAAEVVSANPRHDES